MLIHNLIQGSPEWNRVRCGKLTASRFSDILAKGQGKTRTSYLYEIAAEILTREKKPEFINTYMEWGMQTEPVAKLEYIEKFGAVQEVGFVEHEDYVEKICGVGCSPDGILNNEGLLEIKCPNTTTHIEYKLSGKFPSKYQAQIQGQMWICEAKWAHFMSYDPRIKSDAKIFLLEVERDEAFIANLKKEIDLFINDLSDILSKLGEL